MSAYMHFSEKALQEHLRLLRIHYLQSLPGRVARLVQSISNENTDKSVIHSCIQQAYDLAASAAIFSCPEISVLAREIHTLCQQRAEPDQPLQPNSAHMNDLLLQLQQTCRNTLAGIGKGADLYTEQYLTQPHNSPRIYILDVSAADAKILSNDISSAGYTASRYESVDTLRTAVELQQPDAIVCDIACIDELDCAAEVIFHCTHDLLLPVVLLGTDSGFDSRLFAARLGACDYLIKPFDQTCLLDTLDRVTAKLEAETYHLLFYGDELEDARHFCEYLQATGFVVDTAHDPAVILTALETTHPDAIIVDTNHTGITNTEVAALIRQIDEHEHVPIIFLGDDSSSLNLLKANYPGINSFLNKSGSPAVLARAIKAQAENARRLRDGRASLHLAIKHIDFIQGAIDKHAIIALTDTRGRITYVNQKFSEISGYSAQELLGRTHSILKSGRHSESYYEDLWRTISSGNVWHGTLTNQAKDGKLYDVNTTIVPKLDETGQPEQYFSIRTDITAVTQLERRISAEADRLNLALEATRSGMWEWNIDTGKVIYGPSWRGLLQYADDTPLSWPMLIATEDLDNVVTALMRHIEGESTYYESEHRIRDGNGEWHWVRETGRVIESDTEGWASRIVGTTQIIDERIALEQQKTRMQEQLLRTAKMESIGHLTAGIAHDFNNLLGGILGYAELSLELLGDAGETENIKSYLAQVLKAGNRAKDLISQMLLFSRVNPDMRHNEAPVIQLKPVIAEVVQLARSSIPSSIKVNYQVEDDAIKARIEPVHMHQLLLNLVLNARDAIGEFGQIEIQQTQQILQHSCSSCHASFSGDYLSICVKDTGSGIPQETLTNIFDPFFSTKEVGKGTGMGLSVVHGILHSLNGHIIIDSQPGQGTTMCIVLPTVNDSTTADVSAEEIRNKSRENKLHGLRIMVVDDETAISTMLTEFLTFYGAIVTTHNKPDKALAEFIRKPDAFDLVITDATMPDISGLELSRAMLQVRSDIPILLCTGYSSYVNEEIALGYGISGFMTKPIDIAHVLSWIKTNTSVPPRARGGSGI